MAERVRRYFFYFTIQSNIAVAWGLLLVVRRPDVRHPACFAWCGSPSVIGITVTGVVHWFFLRPILDLEGSSYLADKLLHVARPAVGRHRVPALRPRGRVRRSDIPPTVAVAHPLARGHAGRWDRSPTTYPYPFVDVDAASVSGVVLVNCLGVAVLFCALCFGCLVARPKVASR